ncbi:phenylacetate--CoA ligase family protein [Flagellimonas sp. CMM7]|uniref:phenylacetate--CoA ligase family protein n=1 Tax=Flagellimonas sp. CMM7 TaxID=2654676 RepID=UPI0013D38A72|nr:phenylacetate--CoA ligase family protein [Flagellimonas sp. CMM7]UII81570.1 hypothetical protein LV704_08640 [Flagellimonas sp. CMM7]
MSSFFVRIKRHLFENIKDRIPVEVNKVLIELNCWPTLVFGREYKEHFSNLKNNQINPNLEQQVLNITNFCLKNVPYYRKRYSRYSIKSIADFYKIIKPIDKQEVLDNFEDFIADGIKMSDYDFVTTGGTSGKPLNLYLPKKRYAVELATLHYVWGKLGYNFSKRGVIRNTKLKKNKDYIINPISKEFIFDGFRLNNDYFETIFDTLKRNNINFLHGYTSNLFLFGKFLIANNKDFSFIKGLFTTSENTSQLMNSFFNQELKIPHMNFYGHTEKLVFASYCENTDFYHVDSFYGYTEILNSSNKRSKFGEITGTTINNYGMPLLRYKTGDYTQVAECGCENCDFKGLIFKEIYGRWDGSKIYNKDGSSVTTTALNLHSELYAKIEGIQYFQHQKGKLQVRIIKGEAFSKTTELELRDEILSKFNLDFELDIKYVGALEKKSNGKFLLLISKIH